METVNPLLPEPLGMDNQQSSSYGRAESPRPSTHRQRSNSFPIVEALGCSTPEAQLILAEGRAAVRKRRARGWQNRSVDDQITTPFDPRDHLIYLESVVTQECAIDEPMLPDSRSCHARIPSNTTDRSTSTVIPLPHDGEARTVASPNSPLGDYSANLAQFIKAQLNSIPTYQGSHDSISPLSPKSCPDFSFPMQTPPLSPKRSIRRLAEAPKVIDIPPIRPPARSAFSAWSSTDDEVEDDVASLPDMDRLNVDAISKGSNYAPSILGYYEAANNASFLFSSTPLEEDEPDTAKASTFHGPSDSPKSTSEHQDDEGYPSSCLSRPQLTSSSAPSYSSSSASASSYFDYKRPIAIAPQIKNRIIAALTPPHPHNKTISAISPWEGGAIANVHDVFVESQQRVHVDGMSFDMLRDFTMPGRVTTPC